MDQLLILRTVIWGSLCGSTGCTRLAYLDMSDATQNCPSGFGLYNSGGVRVCGKPVR
uniref:Lipoprotein n=1 Tax=Amphimedon queenslandica TaxID=400682 RepID=A0A1X7UBW8_AMPQE